jgi:hypothetical protein
VQQGPAARDGCLLDDLEALPDKGRKVRRGKPGRKDFARGAAGGLDGCGCRRRRAPGLLLPGGLLPALFLLALPLLLALLPRGPRIVVTGTGPAGAYVVVVIIVVVVVAAPAVVIVVVATTPAVVVVIIVAAPAVVVITVAAAPAIVAAIVVIAAAAATTATSAASTAATSAASTAVAAIVVIIVIIVAVVVVIIGLRKGGGVTVDGDSRREVQGEGQQKRQEKRLVSKVGHNGLLGRVDRRPCSTS